MATLPIQPTLQGTSKKQQPRQLWNDFGDGYSQRAADGINNNLQEWQVSWESLSRTDIKTLDDFFNARKDGTAFEWTPQDDWVERKFVCTIWGISFINQQTNSMTATFKEVADLT